MLMLRRIISELDSQTPAHLSVTLMAMQISTLVRQARLSGYYVYGVPTSQNDIDTRGECRACYSPR